MPQSLLPRAVVSTSFPVIAALLAPKLTALSGNRRMDSAAATERSQNGATSADDTRPSAQAFLRPHLLTLAAYTPIEPFEILSERMGRDPSDIVKLDANENPYGPPPEVLEALGSMQFPNIYPDPQSRLLRASLSESVGVPAENLLVRLPFGSRHRTPPYTPACANPCGYTSQSVEGPVRERSVSRIGLGDAHHGSRNLVGPHATPDLLYRTSLYNEVLSAAWDAHGPHEYDIVPGSALVLEMSKRVSPDV